MMSDLFRKACAVPRRKKRPPLVWLVLVVASAWLVAACADGGDSETTQTDSAAGETDGDLASDAGGGAGADSESEPVTPDDSDAQETAQTEDADDEPTASDTATASPTTTTTAAPTTTTTEPPTTTTTRAPATTQPPTTRPPATTAPPTTRAPATTTQPPTTTTTQAPSQALWTAPLTVGEPVYETSGGYQYSLLGFDTGAVDPDGHFVEAAGALDPATYEYQAGSTTVISRLAAHDNDYELYLDTSAGHDGLQGLWLKLSDDLAVPIESYHDRGRRSWHFTYPVEGLSGVDLDWAVGDEVEVSLWDRDPIPQPQKLWSATLTAQDIDDEHSQGNDVAGYADGVAGSLDPGEYEYEPGKTTRITRFVMGYDGAEIGAENPEALEGLWLEFRGDGYGVPIVDKPRDGIISVDVGVCPSPWPAGETVEVALWDRNPWRAEQYVPSNEQIGRESIEGQGESEGRGEPRGVPDDGDRAPRC